MKIFSRILILLIFLITLAFSIQFIKILLNTNKLTYQTRPFEYKTKSSTSKILFIGDSTAVGTGTSDLNKSTAGWLHKDFPNAQIDNFSKNGRKIIGVVREFDPSKFSHYDLIIIQIGGNDILRWTSLKDIDNNLDIVISKIKKLSDNIIILHSGNVGCSPIFTWPFNWLYTERTRAVRSIYLKKAKEHSIYYVDLFQETKEDLFRSDIKLYYSPDMLHPSGEGYHWWYKNIRKTIDKMEIKL